ncbi:tail fiber domain-containing protein [Psychroserpens sp. AS72]|uniref:tail fiber domain-containing protein n=1 Tax=Psychroserpens sp. AS72 TaxID=3135775 RepID=UPI00316BB2B0
MKTHKKSILILTCMLLLLTMQAQQGINYKAVIKDAIGNVLANQTITIQFQILKGEGMTNVYQEYHTPTTDINGIAFVNIGTGTTSDVFADIDWRNDDHFLNVQINTGSGLIDLGTTQFMAVPYALTAANAATKINELHDGKSDVDGSSLFLGIDAGLNDDGTDNKNVGIGNQTLSSNTTGVDNTATGSYALLNNTIGVSNTGIGYRALAENTTGNNNTAIGKLAGENNVNGQQNTSVGTGALQNNISGNNNTAIGFTSLVYNTSGNDNTAIGRTSLYSNTTGNYNTANGKSAMYYNTTGAENTAVGHKALQNNTTGSQNTAIGDEALFSNILGNFNSAFGYKALYSNTGFFNMGIGCFALMDNTNGTENTAIGHQALLSNTSGNTNTAVGFTTLLSNTVGIRNTAIGSRALLLNTTGGSNVAVGYNALLKNINGGSNTALGYWALVENTSGVSNTAIGADALGNVTTGNNNIGIGKNAQVPNATGSNQIRIGNTQISYAGIQVNWSATSDKRWKDNIRRLPYGLDVVKALRPVDYIRKNNDTKTREMGFIAQDVEALLLKEGYTDQGFLHKDDNGFMSLRYNDFIALLTKAIQEQQEIIDRQNNDIKSLTAELVETKEKQNSNYQKLLIRIEQIEATNKY